MFKFVVAPVAALVLVSGPALAREIPTNAEECARLADVTRTVIDAEKPKPEAASAINALMTQLDEQCANSQFEEAQNTAEMVIAKVTEGD